MKPVVRPSIVAVFEHYGLRIIGPDRGSWRKAECPKPDHIDQNPSASISEDGERWWCHACNEGGDGLDVIGERENLDFGGASVFAAKHFEGNDVERNDERSSLLPQRKNRGGRSVPPWLRI